MSSEQTNELYKKILEQETVEEKQNRRIALEIMEIFKSNQISYRQARIILDTVHNYVECEAVIQ